LYFQANKLIPAGWDLNPRTITYLVQQQGVDENGLLELAHYDTVQLVFRRPAGNVLLKINGEEHPSRMNRQGRIYPNDPESSYFYWEIFFLSVIPPDGELEIGKSWTLKRPGDDEIEDLATITSQAQMIYLVESTNPAIISYKGMNRISPSSKLDAMAEDFNFSKDLVNRFVTDLKPYAEGRVEFSTEDGATKSAEGIVVTWAAFGEAMDLKENPGRTHFKITRI
jgi:hypothetical protein